MNLKTIFKSKAVREIILFVVVGIVAFGIAHAVRGGDNDESEQSQERVAGVTIVTAERKDSVTAPYVANAAVTPKQTTEIQSVVSGTLISLQPIGSQVSIGTPLFRISNPSAEQSYFAALTSLANAQGNLSQTGFATESQLAESRLRVSSAELSLQAAERMLADGQTSGELARRQAVDSAAVAYDSAYRAVESAMRFLGGPNLDGFIYDDVTSNDVQGVGQLKNQFDAAVIAFKQTPKFPQSISLAELAVLEQTVIAAKDFTQSAWTYLRLGVPNPFFTQEQLSSAVSLVGATSDQMNGANTQIKNARNTLSSVVEQTNAQISSLRSQVDLAKVALENAKQSLSTQEANASLSGIGAQGQVTAARAQLASLQYQYDNLTLNSPFAGTIISHKASIGSQVSPGVPLLSLGDLEIVEIKLQVTPEVASAIQLGQEVSLSPGRNGRISRIDAAADAATGKVNIVIEASNSENEFASITSVETTINLNFSVSGAFILPISAVTVVQTGSHVWVEQEGKVLRRVITTGRVYGEYIEILSGLEVGDQVVVSSTGLLKEGEAIEIQN